jgi:ATP-dependent Lhr-like helicase
MEAALAALETQGIVLRGRFTEGSELEWCDRRLLARIHRLTLEGLRRQIAPVPPEQFARFLVRHQHLQPQTKLQGKVGLLALIEQLEGFEAPAGHWEKYLLPARLESYDPAWLDSVTFFGHAAWGRLRPLSRGPEKGTGSFSGHPGRDSGMKRARPENEPVPFSASNGARGKGRPLKALTRSTPITIMVRDHVSWLLPLGEENAELAADYPLGSNARAAYEAFLRHGALFPVQVGSLLELVPAQVEDVLGELAAAGLVTSDGYPALRALVGMKMRNTRRRAQRSALSFSRAAGRWTLLRSALMPAVAAEERAEHWSRLLLRRYGAMFRDLLANESAAPLWQELVRSYRRLEARGEIRGGRFVAGVAGEQYALPEAIPMLRSNADAADETPLVLPATDPLNLTGRILPGPRVPALPGQWIHLAQGKVRAHEPAV